MFSKILIANRGEIALRVIRTAKRMGIHTVAVYSDADAHAPHVTQADEAVRLGPAAAAESYLRIDKVIAAAQQTGAQAIHPGYGFLSENAQFAQACEDAGIVFLGPTAESIQVMGDKITAKQAVASRGVPLVPGVAEAGLSDEQLAEAATEVGFPILIKPSAGGGGKGMHAVFDQADLADSLAAARREAASSFGDDTLFIERLIATPRHIEVQILADEHGNVIHLGERECSLQRRHQKVIEEAPSALLGEAARARIGQAAVDTAKSVNYRGAGTVEFIASADNPDEFFFMEMNTRLQVEHPVTEEVTGVDLVEWQLRIGAGEELTLKQDDITLNGHSIEARIYAEDPARGFLPTGGRALEVRFPDDVRVDAGLSAGQTIVSAYDPMIAKVIVHAPTREQALAKMDHALAASAVPGIVTNIDFLRFLVTREDVIAGELDTGLIDRLSENELAHEPGEIDLLAATAAVMRERGSLARRCQGAWGAVDAWRTSGTGHVSVELTYQGEPIQGRYRGEQLEWLTAEAPNSSGAGAGASADGQAGAGVVNPGAGAVLRAQVGDVTHLTHTWVDNATRTVWVASTRGVFSFGIPLADNSLTSAGAGAQIKAPMPGAVTAVHVADGDEVTEGQPILVLEAMKMEHVLRAPADGVVELSATPGLQVTLDQVLATVVVAETETADANNAD